MASTRETILETALMQADALGLNSLSVTAITKALGIQPPALYKHFDGLPDLERNMKMVALRALRDSMAHATIGVAGAEALRALLQTIRTFAKTYPARYQLTVKAQPDDQEIASLGFAIVQISLKVLSGFDLSDDEAIHQIRIMRATIHGFVSLENSGGFGLPQSIDRSFERLCELLIKDLQNRPHQVH